MGRSKMTSLTITLLPLAICFLLSLNSQVSGKPSPKHFLIETKENAKVQKNSDYDVNSGVLNNNGGTINSKDYESAPIRTTERITVINSKDYDINAGSFVNHGHVVSNDYDVNSRVLNNNGGTINSKDYDINAGSFVNHGHVASFGGK